MIVIAGTFELEPTDRDAFVASRSQQARDARARPGNLEYAWSLDAVNPGLVRLTELWADRAALDAHAAAVASTGGPSAAVPVIAREIRVWEAEEVTL